MKNINFISYTGKYPALCYGTLTVEIDGKKTIFGFEKEYPRFWASGGSVSFDNEWNETILQGDWELLYDKNDFPFDKETMQQLINVMNENVNCGCCGGCV